VAEVEINNINTINDSTCFISLSTLFYEFPNKIHRSFYLIIAFNITGMNSKKTLIRNWFS